MQSCTSMVKKMVGCFGDPRFVSRTRAGNATETKVSHMEVFDDLNSQI